MIGIYIHIFVCVAALGAAFVAQWILPPRRRTRIIFAAAAAPCTLLIVAALVTALLAGADEGWFRAAISLAFSFIWLMFFGLVGAIAGSELASLTRWFLRRH